MKQLTLVGIFLFSILTVNAQGYYFNLGQNFTKYDYKNSIGQRNPNIQSDNGLMVDFGFQWIFPSNEKWQYKTGLSFQQFNASGNNTTSDFSWNTSYLGIQNSLSYAVYTSNGGEVAVNLNGGFTGSTIVKGEQIINYNRYNLIKNEEFKGLFIQPHIGIENEFHINDYIKIGLGYRFSKAFRINSESKESLNFINNAIYFNFKYFIY